MERVILHADMNNFYASVECLYNPELRGKPVAVAGDPLWLAKQKCPDIVFTPPHYDLYIRYSQMAQEIYSEYTDQVESFGLDECWLDVSASTHLFGSGKQIADELRKRIKFELRDHCFGRRFFQ